MSTFGGKIKEIPEISIDRFDGDNLFSDVFFLSHCHTDHMRGLNKFDFINTINRENRFIYMSTISSNIIKASHPFSFEPDFHGHIIELSIKHPTSIEVNGNIITVTSIPSGHCPGSIMFLFETHDSRILYTGDYRIGPSDIRKFKCFYNSLDDVKTIDCIYLDTTFFSKNYPQFPKREESLKTLCKIIDEWIRLGPEHVIKLDVPAYYGYEYIFRGLFYKFKTPLHVTNDKYDFYSLIPELDKCFTTDGNSTNLHCCCLGRIICPSIDVKKNLDKSN